MPRTLHLYYSTLGRGYRTRAWGNRPRNAFSGRLWAAESLLSGSPRMSRLLPLFAVAVATELDPWAFDPERTRQYVFLRQRGPEKRELAFDPTDPVPARVQRQLELVNAVNANCQITYEPYDPWDDCFTGERRLRPVHHAAFTDDWLHHGRIYASHHGQQALRKLERQTIRFDGERSRAVGKSQDKPHAALVRIQPAALWVHGRLATAD